MSFIDARTPVRSLTDPNDLPAALAEHPAAVLLAEDAAPLPQGVTAPRFTPTEHAATCACCTGRLPIAVALDGLFLARVRGTIPWFSELLVLAPSPAAQAGLARALREDAVTAARFRAAS